MRLDIIENFFTATKDNFSSHMIQEDMASQSHRNHIPTLLQSKKFYTLLVSYKSNEPLTIRRVHV
jgi:hypothetical protein